MTKKIEEEKFINYAIAFHGYKFNYDTINYIDEDTPLEIICRQHGPYMISPSDHMKSTTGGCQLCNGIIQYTTEDFIKKSNVFHNSKYDYSLTKYISNTNSVKIICPIHGEFEQMPVDHYKYGCFKCIGKDVKSKDNFILESKIVHYNKFDYTDIDYHDMYKKIKISCKQHGEFNQIPINHLYGRKGCAKCSKKSSKNEMLWLDIIDLPNDADHRNVYININDIKYYVDGFDSKTNTIYEYNIDYWHGNLLTYNAEDIHPELNVTFSQIYNITKNRHTIFERAGYTVKTIWESDFIASQKDKTKIIIHDNKYGQYITDDTKTFNKLKNILSFKTAGVEYTAAFKNGWNGITYLLDNKGYFLVGLLPKVMQFIEENNIPITLIDKSNKNIAVNDSIDLSNRLNELNLQPRSYQTKIVEAALANNKGIVRACTGSGKSLCTALITAKINKPTIIYVIGLDLLTQFHDLFSKLFDEKIGFIGNGICDIQRINIASIWTISSALKIKSPLLQDDDNIDKELEPSTTQSINILNMLESTRLHIFDESHVVTTDTIKQIFNKINPEHIYGFSGTPFRDDGSDLLINSILGEQIINVPASELIVDGYLAQPIIKFVKVPKLFIDGGTSNYQSVYKAYVTDNIIRNNLIVENTIELLTKNYQVLVLFKHLQHGKNLQELFDAKGVKYEYLSGSDPLDVRMAAKENLTSHKSNLVLASSIFDIGIDVPSLSALVLAGGGKSSIRTLQRVGRVIRKYKTKKHAAIVDFYDDVRFLKNHSKRRYQIYKSEIGFKVILQKNITDLK